MLSGIPNLIMLFFQLGILHLSTLRVEFRISALRNFIACCQCNNGISYQTGMMLPRIARFMGLTWAHLGPTGLRWASCWPMNFAIWDGLIIRDGCATETNCCAKSTGVVTNLELRQN